MNLRRVLLVDRNDDFLDGVSSLLAGARGVRVVGRAHSGAEAIERAAELSPDLVLMDITLAEMSGLRAVPWLKRLRPAPRVLLLTFHDSHAAGAAALAAGADGCLCKADIARQLVPAVEELLWSEAERVAPTPMPERWIQSSTETEP